MKCHWLIVFHIQFKSQKQKQKQIKNIDLQFLSLMPPNIQTCASTFHLHVDVSQNLLPGI